VCGREVIDCIHSGGLKLKISVDRLSSRLCEGSLAVDPNGNWLTQGHLNPVTFSGRKQGGGVFKAEVLRSTDRWWPLLCFSSPK
jgi:hypothetical protein